MNKYILILSFVFVNIAIAEQYDDRYDDINIEEILNNKRLLSSYLKCLLNKGRCTPEGQELKVHIQDGLQSGCSKCTGKQRVKAKQVINYLRQNEKQYWNDVISKYDPKDEYKATYEAFLASKD